MSSNDIKETVFDGKHFSDISFIAGKVNNFFAIIPENLNLRKNNVKPTQFLSPNRDHNLFYFLL